MADYTTSLLIRSDKVAARLFEGRMLVITPDDSILHRLNEVGTFIWQLLGSPCTIESICFEVAAQFQGFDPVGGRGQIESFIRELIAKHLVEVAA